MITIEQILHRIDDIKQSSDDDESAHAKEDQLREEILQAIASGWCEDPREYASLALTTADIRFARWCA